MLARRMIIMLVAAAVVFGGVFGFIAFGHYMRDKFMHSMGIPPQTVATMVAGSQEWQPRLQGVGSLRAVSGADLSAQVVGTVSAIHFESGADVTAGTLLVELASGDDVGKLLALKATAALAQITLDRDQRQLKVQGVSQQTVDADLQNLKNAQAQVVEQQATVDYKNIKAPFDGRLGIRQVDVGQYVAAGTPMVTLQALDPIYVDFYLPQQSIAQIKVGQKVNAKIDAYPGRAFPGEISAINPKIDNATRNVQIRATLKNADHALVPGMYATVEIDVGRPERHVTLPATAIAYNSYGSTVFLVDDKGKTDDGHPALVARQVFVTTGATRGDQVSILNGVKDGDTVVVAGQIKLRNGIPVVVDNTILPKFDANPVPTDQ
ncbi:MAG: efflux transporter periplasmic adaptor subunit [Rhodospirillales bacterium]|nr:efflux transporter periplasmic adaptor subunit [Rhodospirillales bacterium]